MSAELNDVVTDALRESERSRGGVSWRFRSNEQHWFSVESRSLREGIAFVVLMPIEREMLF